MERDVTLIFNVVNMSFAPAIEYVKRNQAMTTVRIKSAKNVSKIGNVQIMSIVPVPTYVRRNLHFESFQPNYELVKLLNSFLINNIE